MTIMLSETFKRVKAASKSLVFLTDDHRNEVLQALADAIENHMDCLLAANTIDLKTFLVSIVNSRHNAFTT